MTQPNKSNRKSSIRWQGRTIEQFGYASNLILGLAIAGIGYETTLILNKEIERTCWQESLLVISLLALSLSACVALWCVITRLRNFRLTAKIARKRENGESGIELQALRDKSTNFGDFTWTLLWWQIWSFAIGIISLFVVTICSILN